MSGDIPDNLPFSRAYFRPSELLRDNPKFRARLSALFDTLRLSNSSLVRSLKLKGGIEILAGFDDYQWDHFFKNAPIMDILDAIGIIYEHLATDRKEDAKAWRNYTRTIFGEQSLGYSVNDKGQVRRIVDAESQRIVFSTITGLGKERYRTARSYYQAACDQLEEAAPDTRVMVEGTFDAAEEIFKLMFDLHGGRLVAGNARQHFDFSPLGINPHAKIAAEEMANSFAKWVAASQQFRHAPGPATAEGADPAPPLELALLMFSAGSSFIRWMITLDQEGLSKKAP